MESGFRYLNDKYGDAGAREVFEKICIELFQNIYANAHAVRASPGDDGIDILIGDISEPIIVFQCKYFINGMGAPQMRQIKESYEMVTSKYKVKEWYLCIPIDLTTQEHKAWSIWKNSIYQTDIIISLYDGSWLLNGLKKQGLYDRIFDDDIRNMLGEHDILLRRVDEKLDDIKKTSTNIEIKKGNYYKLPMQSKIFIGRLKELDQIEMEMKNDRIIVLNGVTGIGKSQIAKQFAHIHRHEYNKIYWIFASSKSELLKEYNQIAKINSVQYCDDDVLPQVIKNHLENESNSLIIYDGLDDMCISEIKDILPVGEIDIIITTQNSNWDPNEVSVVKVTFMEPQDTEEFIINNSVGRKVTNTDSEDVKRLSNELNYYPLALEYARAYIVARNISIIEYIDLFKKHRVNLFYSNCTDYRKSALNAWKMSFDKVFEKEHNAYDFMAICSFMGNDLINHYVIFEPNKYDTINLEKIVDTLMQYSMINAINNCVQFHSVTQEFMRYKINDSNEYNRYLHECLQLLRNVLPNNINNSEERDKVISILPHLEATFDFLPEQVSDATIYALGVDISRFLYNMGFSKKSLAINEKILSYALKMGDYEKYCDTSNAIAIAAHYCGDTKKGLEVIEESIVKINNYNIDIKKLNFLKAGIYGNKGIMLKDIQLLSEALNCVIMALDYAEKSGSSDLICRQLLNLGVIYRHLGEIDKAEGYLVKAKKYCEGNKMLEAKVYGNLGFLYIKKDITKAIEYFNISLKLSREIKDQKTECINLNHIGSCYMHLNKPIESYDYFIKANKLALDINLQQSVVHSYINLGKWFIDYRSDIEKAKEYYYKAHVLSKDIGYVEGIKTIENYLNVLGK